MGKYLIETTGGKYEIETQDAEVSKPNVAENMLGGIGKAIGQTVQDEFGMAQGGQRGFEGLASKMAGGGTGIGSFLNRMAPIAGDALVKTQPVQTAMQAYGDRGNQQAGSLGLLKALRMSGNPVAQMAPNNVTQNVPRLPLDQMLAGGVRMASDPRTFLAPKAPEAMDNVVESRLAKAKNTLQSIGDTLLLGDKPKVNVLKQIRSSFQQIPVDARKSFADDLIKLNNEKIMAGQNPSISLKSMVDSIQGDMAMEELKPAVERVINSVPKLQQILKNPQLAENLTLKESQDLLNDVKSTLSQSKLAGSGNRPTDIPIYNDLINEITDAQLSVHPEFAKTKQVFGDIMNQYKLVKGKLGIGLEKNILNKFGGSEANLAAEELLAKNPKALSQIKGFRNMQTAKKVAKNAVGFGAAEEIARNLLFRK